MSQMNQTYYAGVPVHLPPSGAISGGSLSAGSVMPPPCGVVEGYVAEANAAASSIIGDVRTAIIDVTLLADRLMGPIPEEKDSCMKAASLPHSGQTGMVLDTLQELSRDVMRLRDAIFRLRAL